ncbi:hypothetical protein CYLTODRAFT_447373 [Cylindrobasidium torrendii FP15055 ss-10]|uniref:F-box domain-containing protein n=1 Tax=Cylindrobasidium torrendii FP15055 ss-10 TaxID=1314674 RepID=A0A0D7AXX7_9AGAR|nr:hypothetical protein CYLTODRAFT_447373 [Cylindrobasidium torrendii FP15055 ss-10]
MSGPPLDSLWKELGGFLPLVYVLPHQRSTDKRLCISHHVAEADWERLTFYTKRVHKMTYVNVSRSSSFSSTVYARLAALPNTMVLFPSLQSVTMNVHFAAFPAASLILYVHPPPKLRVAEIQFEDKTVSDDIAFTAIYNAMYHFSTIENLKITGTSLNLQAFADVGGGDALKCRSSTLRSLTVSSFSINGATLRLLSHFSSLEFLDIILPPNITAQEVTAKSTGFPSLKALVISTPRRAMISVLGLLPPTTLKSLHIEGSDSINGQLGLEDMAALHEALAERLTLESLTLGSPLFGSQFYVPSPEDPISGRIFHPLTTMSTVTYLSYHGPIPADIHDTPLEGWRNMRTLFLTSRLPVSHRILQSLARCCPHLVKLTMDISIPDEPLDGIVPTNHGLQNAHFRTRALSSPRKVALMLDLLFPHLQVVQGAADGWKGVMDIIACLQASRKLRGHTI